MGITIFQKEIEYENDIQPLLDELKIKCREHGIPFFFQACVASEAESTKYRSEGNLCGSNEIVLFDDKITDHLRIEAGFKTVPPNRGKAYAMELPPDIDEDGIEEVDQEDEWFV